MIALARQFADAGEMKFAVELATQASSDLNAEGESKLLAALLLSDKVPTWHFALVRDLVRNQAYEDALIRAITPGCLVLEIGTGTGILAMMAARAGARVVTCESNPAIAAAAREVIAANGLASKIHIVNKHSSELDLTADLGARADILVSEIISNDLLSEGVLSAHADACSRLIKPNATVIPFSGRVRTALAFDRRAERRAMSKVSGFDLSAFNRLRRPFYLVDVENKHLDLRSAPANLFSIGFDGTQPARDSRTSLELTSTGGLVNGVVQWLALDMDSVGLYENFPGRGVGSSWDAQFWLFEDPIQTEPGQTIRINGHHNQERVRIWQTHF